MGDESLWDAMVKSERTHDWDHDKRGWNMAARCRRCDAIMTRAGSVVRSKGTTWAVMAETCDEAVAALVIGS